MEREANLLLLTPSQDEIMITERDQQHELDADSRFIHRPQEILIYTQIHVRHPATSKKSDLQYLDNFGVLKLT